jgi:hypothetical protein
MKITTLSSISLRHNLEEYNYSVYGLGADLEAPIVQGSQRLIIKQAPQQTRHAMTIISTLAMNCNTPFAATIFKGTT